MEADHYALYSGFQHKRGGTKSQHPDRCAQCHTFPNAILLYCVLNFAPDVSVFTMLFSVLNVSY